MDYSVVYHPEAEKELAALPSREQAALINGDKKLRALGPNLVYPHSSAVRSVPEGRLRELRPRAGNSPYRGLYSAVDKNAFVIAAIGPDGETDPKGFNKAVERALERLEDMESKGN